MIPIIFSIPIHEKLEVVLDQINNYKYFNPECGIVFHFSDKFDYTNSAVTREEFEKAVQDIENVFLNPVSVRTEWCDIIQAHLSNFIYMKGQCEFEYFALCASNEMFIRRGLYQWIREYDCGMQCVEIPEATEWIHAIMAKKDMALKKILQDIEGGEKIIASQVEGTFFKYGLFNDICEVINRNYDYKSMEFAYAREEIYFSTIVWIWKNKGRKINIYKNGTFTYMSREHCLKIKIDDIKRLQSQNDQFFSVKRIEREVNDKVRSYIREEIAEGYLDYKAQLYKTYNIPGTALHGSRHLYSLLSFDGGDISGLLHDMIICLVSAREHDMKGISRNIISLLEYEYGEDVQESILQGDLSALKLLVRINDIIYDDASDHIIRPLHWLLLYVYEKALLKRIGGQDELALYGAGRYGEKFLEFLQRHNLSGKVSCFVVSNLTGNTQEVRGLPVKELSDLLQEAEEKRVLVTVTQKFEKEIEGYLCKNGYKNYEIISQDFLYAINIDPLYLLLEDKL